MPRIKAEAFFGWAICAVLVAAPFVISNRLVDYANLPQSAFIQTSVLVLLVCSCLHIAVKGSLRFPRNPITFIVLLFLLWVVISLLWARNRYEGLHVSFHLISCGMVFFIISQYMDGAKWSQRILMAVVGMGLGVALLGCIQHLFQVTWIPQQVPPAATFGNRNVASHVVCMAVPLLPVAFFLPSTRRLRFFIRISISFMTLVLLAYLFITETRAAWLSCIISVSFVTIAMMKDAAARDSLIRIGKSPLFRILFLSVATFIVLAVFNPKPIQHLLNVSKQKYYTSRRGSIDIRMKMWRNGLEMFKERPIAGWGIGNFKVYYPLYHGKAVIDPAFSEQKRPLNIHNDFLQAAIELGSVGFLLFLGLFALPLFMALRLFQHDQPPEIRLVAIGTGGGILAILVTSIFSFPMQRSLPPLILFTYMGILVAYYNHYILGKKTISMRVPRAIVVPLCVSTTVAALVITQFNYDVLVSDTHYRRSLKMARVSAWPEVIHSGLKSYEVNPYKVAALEAVGWAYVESNQISKGIETLSQVLQADPYNMKAMGKLGDAYYKGGYYHKALEIFERLIAIKRDLPDVLALMGNICIKDRRYSEALGYFEQALTYDQENPLLHTNLGFVKFKLGKYSEAAKEYEKVLTFKPDMFYAHSSLASIYDSYVKVPEKASYHMKRCVEIGGDDYRPGRLGKKLDPTNASSCPTDNE